MRDKYKNLSYFNLFIDQENETIRDFKEFIESGKADSAKKRMLGLAIFDSNLSIASAAYSAGGSKGLVSSKAVEAIESFIEYFIIDSEFNDPDKIYWIVSIAIVCEFDDELFKRLADHLKKHKVKDKLLDFLIKSRFSDWPISGSNFLASIPYKDLSRAIDCNNSDDGIAIIKNYLINKWYQGHIKTESPWIDEHKNTKPMIYSGYWAWEAVALVKVKGWNDEKLKNIDYYPYDANHW